MTNPTWRDWQRDQRCKTETWNLSLDHNGRKIEAWIAARPAYCDRGHWLLQVDGPLDLDWQDCFPRYFMDLARAKAEAEAFLKWRLLGEREV